MLIVMAVDTEIFPVRSIRRIIQMISIFMMYGEKVPRFLIKLSPALGTDEAVYLE